MHERCHAVSHVYFVCLGRARYLVRTERPKESEPPTLCFTHAKLLVRSGMVPQGVIYRHAPDGHGWVVVQKRTRRGRQPHGCDVQADDSGGAQVSSAQRLL